MFQVTPRMQFLKLFTNNTPRAFAKVTGDDVSPKLTGMVYFYPVPYGGIVIEAEIFGLPDTGSPDVPAFYGFHIHENGDCSDKFSKSGSHYNPLNMPHPHHAGDMPPLISYNGYAWMAFYDAGLELYDVAGRSVIVHRNADDFTTQPSGNSGEKIGCGVIQIVGELQSL